MMPLRNSGKGGSGHYASDVYRLSASVSESGWTTWVPNRLATAKAGGQTSVEVWARPGAGAERRANLQVKAVSESDPSKADTGTCRLG
jgi:hypothetical protein